MNFEIEQSLKSLMNNGIILYPTDTIWGIGCDATNQVSVEKVFQLKKRSESKSLILLVSDIEMLKQYVTLPFGVEKKLNSFDKPTTVIYSNPKNIASNCIAADNTVAIRIVNSAFCQKLLKIFKKPIVSTSANVSGNPTPKSFIEIEDDILEGADYVVNLPNHSSRNTPSSIIKVLNDGTIETIRA